MIAGTTYVSVRDGLGISFHRFPADIVRRRYWTNLCGRGVDAPLATENHRECSLHFNEDDFRPGQRKILKNNAIPSKLDPSRVSGEGQGTVSASTQTKYVDYFIIINPHNPFFLLHCAIFYSPKAKDQEILQLQAKLWLMEEELNKKREIQFSLETKLGHLEERFTIGQLTRIYGKSTKSHWADEDLSKGMGLYLAGPKLYKIIQQRFALPCPSTLRRAAFKWHLVEGIQQPALAWLKEQKFEGRARFCIVMLDEMGIRSCFEYILHG